MSSMAYNLFDSSAICNFIVFVVLSVKRGGTTISIEAVFPNLHLKEYIVVYQADKDK